VVMAGPSREVNSAEWASLLTRDYEAVRYKGPLRDSPPTHPPPGTAPSGGRGRVPRVVSEKSVGGVTKKKHRGGRKWIEV